MYLTGNGLQSKIHNQEYGAAMQLLLQRIILIEHYIVDEVNPNYADSLKHLLKNQEKGDES